MTDLLQYSTTDTTRVKSVVFIELQKCVLDFVSVSPDTHVWRLNYRYTAFVIYDEKIAVCKDL